MSKSVTPELPRPFTPHEIARNRLAKSVFTLCVAVILFVVTVGQSAKEFHARQMQLLQELRDLDALRGRVVTFIEPNQAYFVDRLLAAFDVICLTPQELGIPDHKAGTSLVYGGKAVLDREKARDLRRRCDSVYIEINVVSPQILHPIATMLTRLLVEHGMTAETAIALTRQQSAAPQQELLDLLVTYWEVDGLAQLVGGRWLDWRSMKRWVSTGDSPTWIHAARDRRLTALTYNPSWTEYESLDLGRLTSKFTQQYGGTYVDRARTLVRGSNDASQALAYIEAKATEASQDLRVHAPNTKWSDIGIGGVSIPLLQWVEWTPWAIVILLGLFVVFDGRIRSGEVPEPTSFWFPRLGSPRDPLVGPKPKGEQWVAATSWCAYLIMPSLICYWAMATRLQILSWSDLQSLLWRDIGGTPIDWWSPVAFAASLALTAYATSPTNAVSTRHRSDAKLAAYFCVATAVSALALVTLPRFLASRMSAEPVVDLLWDGRLYLVAPLVVNAVVAFQFRRNISRLALALLVTYTGLSAAIFVRLTALGHF